MATPDSASSATAPGPSPAARAGLALCGLGLLLVYPLAWIIHPLVTSGRGPALCAYNLATEKLCPFCGMTRAFASVMRGDLSSAFGYNVLWWIPFILLACTGAVCLLDGLAGTRIFGRMGPRLHRPALFLLALFLLFGLYRAFL